MRLSKSALRFTLVLACVVAFGCASGRTGREITADELSTIVKGKTTRQDVESKLGSPMSTSMLGDGRRMSMYLFSESTAKSRPETFIPIVGLFVGGTDTTTRQQQLQIIYGATGVVEDFEFSDSKGTGSMSSNPFDMSVNTAPASRPK